MTLPSLQPIPTYASTKSSSLGTGAIAGIAVGAAAIIIGALVLFFFLRRKKIKAQRMTFGETLDMVEDDRHETSAQPYLSPVVSQRESSFSGLQ